MHESRSPAESPKMHSPKLRMLLRKMRQPSRSSWRGRAATACPAFRNQWQSRRGRRSRDGFWLPRKITWLIPKPSISWRDEWAPFCDRLPSIALHRSLRHKTSSTSSSSSRQTGHSSSKLGRSMAFIVSARKRPARRDDAIRGSEWALAFSCYLGVAVCVRHDLHPA